ncbi:tetratricopeptide repeat protein [Bacteroidales bacterium]|nr:tetratricopeptide repeat protein [Bacteroidales bacterium]
MLFSVFVINFIGNDLLHAQQFNRQLKKEFHPYQTSSDTVKINLIDSLSIAVFANDTHSIVETRLYLSMIERIRLNYGEAFNQSGEALFLAEEISDTLLMAKAHEEYGVLNYLFKQDEQSYIHFSKSLGFYKAALRSQLISQSELYRPYYNVMLYYQRIKDDKNAMTYIDSCNLLAIRSGLSNSVNIFLNEKKASVLFRQKQYEQAIALLHQSLGEITRYTPESNELYEIRSFLIVLYASLANCYFFVDEIELAKQYLKKSIQQKDFYGEHTFYRSYVYSRYAKILFDAGNEYDAYKNLLIAKNINDTYLNPRNEGTQNFLSIKDRYGEELRHKNTELQRKNIELARNRQDILRIRIYLFVAVFVIVVLLLIMKNRNEHLIHQKENARNLQKQQQSEQRIDKQNKELTSSMLQLIEKEEVIKTLRDRLEQDPSNKSLLSAIEKQSGSLWDAFNTRFMDLNSDFYDKLKENVSGLSTGDLKICALIKLNFSGKEMAYLLGISEGSVNVARHRLRKKMNLDRDMNLSQFIHSI